MNFLQRAINYVTRRITKSILLAVTFFVIGNLVILGLGISQAATNAKILTRKQMRAAISYEVDYQKFWSDIEGLSHEEQNEIFETGSPRISEETADMMLQDKRIKTANYMAVNVMHSSGFENVKIGNKMEEEQEKDKQNGEGPEAVFSYQMPNISLYALKLPQTIEITEETWKIKEGRFISQEDIDGAKPVVCVTEELAAQNGFKIGDSIKLSEFDESTKKTYGEQIQDLSSLEYEMEIIGIYTTKNEVDPNARNFEWMSPFESPKNIVLTPFTAYATYTEGKISVLSDYYKVAEGWSDSEVERFKKDAKPSLTNITFLLDDPLEVDGFVEDYQPKLEQYTKLNANNETFKKLARPLDTLSFFASIIVWIVVINAIVIISLVTALTLKTREFEIGVLLSIGVSKFKILLQLFLELIIVAFVGFTLAVVSGSLIAGSAGKAVLEYQTATDAQYGPVEEEEDFFFGASDYFSDVSQEDLFAQYEVKVSPLLIGEIYLMGTFVVLIAIVVPTFMIMRLNPKQILLEQH